MTISNVVLHSLLHSLLILLLSLPACFPQMVLTYTCGSFRQAPCLTTNQNNPKEYWQTYTLPGGETDADCCDQPIYIPFITSSGFTLSYNNGGGYVSVAFPDGYLNFPDQTTYPSARRFLSVSIGYVVVDSTVTITLDSPGSPANGEIDCASAAVTAFGGTQAGCESAAAGSWNHPGWTMGFGYGNAAGDDGNVARFNEAASCEYLQMVDFDNDYEIFYNNEKIVDPADSSEVAETGVFERGKGIQ